MSSQFLQENAVGTSIKGFTDVQGSLPKDPVNQAPKQAQVCPPRVQGYALDQSSERVKICPLEVQCGGFIDGLPCIPDYCKLYYFMVTVPLVASNHHISYQPLSICKQQV
ncbi:hypothetical protein BTVI_53915 [Pitangus sulphuratus]|nr:hypothetical protein BTVI_53915 [Pitangus sulphuratus]